MAWWNHPAVLSLVLVILAGCVATPSPPVDTPTPAPEELPPGVAPEGTVNQTVLVNAHWTALQRTGYKGKSLRQYTGPDYRFDGIGTIMRRSTFLASDGKYPVKQHYELAEEQPDGTVGSQVTIMWRNTTDKVTKRIEGNSDQPTVLCRWENATENSTLRGSIFPFARVFSFGEFTITDVNQTGNSTVTSLRATTDNTTVSALVDSEGRIHHLERNTTYTNADGQTVTREWRFTLSTLGVDTVPREEWVDTAMTQIPNPERNTCIDRQ